MLQSRGGEGRAHVGPCDGLAIGGGGRRVVLGRVDGCTNVEGGGVKRGMGEGEASKKVCQAAMRGRREGGGEDENGSCHMSESK
jgi:hypothetical protein